MELSERRKGDVAHFLEKLYEMLEDPRYNSLICWGSDGETIMINKVGEFSENVLPKFYKHKNFHSFVRQLNMYSFTKTCHDANNLEFRQANFQRGKPELLKEIKRKGTGQSSIGGDNKQAVATLDAIQKSSAQLDEIRQDLKNFVQQLANTENQLWITNERYNRLRQENLALWKLLCDAFLPKREAGELLNLVLERQIAEKEKSAQSALKLGVSEHFPAHALTLPASLDAALNSLPLLPTSLLPVTTSASSPLSYPVLSSPLLPSSMVSTEMASTVFSVPALPTSVLPDSPVPVNVVPVSMPAITTQAAPVHAALTLEKTVAPGYGEKFSRQKLI